MSYNYKNLLQEYCQKKRIDLPIYTSEQAQNSRGQVGWRSYVCVSGFTYKTDMCFQSKKDAEQYIAQHAYVDLTKTPAPTAPVHAYNQPVTQLKQPAIQLNQPVTQPIQAAQAIYQDTFDFPDELFQSSQANSPAIERKSDTSPSHSSRSSLSLGPSYVILCDIENIQPNLTNYTSSDSISMHFFQSSYSSVDKKKYIAYGIVHEVDLAGSDVADHLMTYVGSRLQQQNPSAVFVIISRDKSSGILATMIRNDGSKVEHFKSASSFEEYLSTITGAKPNLP